MNVWMEQTEPTVFFRYNFDTHVVEQLSASAHDKGWRAVLMIPLYDREGGQTQILVPSPEVQSADVYIFEVDNIQVNSPDPEHRLIYMPDQYSSQNATIMMGTTDFANLTAYLQTSESVANTKFMMHFYYQCENLLPDLVLNCQLLVILSTNLTILMVYQAYWRRDCGILAVLTLMAVCIVLVDKMIETSLLWNCPWPLETSTMNSILGMV